MKVIAKDISEIDLAIFYESVDGRLSFVDQFKSFEGWKRETQTLLHLAELQETDEPVLELEFEGEEHD
ncbi:hypothetical protein [Lactococcus taiwanensis]|uniref:hypothetical protein n=1 Tax=Lactococcus taiwanensis TaxID=1151742 RepID=UPI0035121FC5